MEKFKKLSRDEMRNVNGGLVDPTCYSSGICSVTIFNQVEYGTCDGAKVNNGCECVVGSGFYASPDCLRGA